MAEAGKKKCKKKIFYIIFVKAKYNELLSCCEFYFLVKKIISLKSPCENIKLNIYFLSRWDISLFSMEGNYRSLSYTIYFNYGFECTL